MANTYIVHEGQTGAVSQYAVPFEYLSTTHVKVTVNDTPAAFTFLSTYLIDILPNPVGTVRIYRDTPDEAITTFTDGSVLLDDDLNSAFVQSIYISQEAKDTATDEMAGTLAASAAFLADTEEARDTSVAAANASLELRDEVETLHGEVTAAASTATAAAGASGGFASEAALSATAAAASLTEAEALVASLEEGPVLSVNGRTNVVTGLAEAADVYTKTQSDTALGLKADKSTTYTKTEVDGFLAVVANETNSRQRLHALALFL